MASQPGNAREASTVPGMAERPAHPAAGTMGMRPAGAVRRRNWRMPALVLAVCLAPVVASYLLYYTNPPAGRTNYGELVEPQVDVPDFAASTLAGQPFRWSSELRGRWVMVTTAPAACDADCRARLWAMRQVRLTAGKDRDRVERLWIVTDGGSPDAALLAEHEGLIVVRADGALSAGLFAPASNAVQAGHVWMVDPMAHVMMRFPTGADPNRMKRDLARLLRASRIG